MGPLKRSALRMAKNIELKCPKSMFYHIERIKRGEYDVPEYSHPRPVILDIGANVGGFALWAANRWPNSEIFCYEPVPGNFELLKINVSNFKKPGARSRIHVNNFAIGNPTRTKMFVGRNNCGEASFFDLGEQQKTAVAVTTQPPTIMPRAHILKLDAEGSEIEILTGLDLINYDVVLLEYHSEYNRRLIDAILRDYTLIGGYVRGLNRGTLKYVNPRLVRTAKLAAKTSKQ